MDCPKCGYALFAFEKDCARCRAIAAEEFARSPAAVWPPVIGPQIAAAPPPPPFVYPAPTPQDTENSSGEERGGPPEIEDLRWNWGAFFCGWLWCFFHKTAGLALLVIAAGIFLACFNVFILPAGYALPSELMAVVLFGLCCYLGLHGHQFAWERRRFPGGVPQYLAVQRAWAVGGAVAFGVSALFCLTLGFFFLAAFRAYEARRQAIHPPPVSAAAPTGPAPVVLRRSAPEPLRQPLPFSAPVGGRGYNPAEEWRRHTDLRYRRDTDPRLAPLPQTVPTPPPSMMPPAAPAPGPMEGTAGSSPELGGPPPSAGSSPPAPLGEQATPPSPDPAPAADPPGAPTNSNAGP